MEDFFSKKAQIERNLGEEFLNHEVFSTLKTLTEFYSSMSFSIMGFLSIGVSSLINLDTYIFSSIHGTLESISQILHKGRINDAYALLRKYFDATYINIYSNLYLDNNLRSENLIVDQIENWKNGNKALPRFRVISSYIKNSSELKKITDLLLKDNIYEHVRRRCNDHTHYNFFQNILLNDNEIILQKRINVLGTFSEDLENIFIQHFAYLFYLKDYYMSSSDFMDALELGITPITDSQYFVAPFIQSIFDSIVKEKRPDIAAVLKSNTSMFLE